MPGLPDPRRSTGRPDGTFRLLTLGRIALVPPSGKGDETLNARRRKLALLAVLALADRPMSRDTLVEMFWGDQEESRARHSLSDAISHLRRVLGRDAIVASRAEVELAPRAPLAVDAIEFADAVAAKDDARALALYAGPFLDAVFVDGSATFEQWSTRERSRLERSFLQASSRHCRALAEQGRWNEGADVAERWLEASPMSADAAISRLKALAAPGTQEAVREALAEYERIRARLAREFDLAPDPAVVTVVGELSAGAGAGGAAEEGAGDQHPSGASVPIPAPLADRPRAWSGFRPRVMGLAVGVVLTLAAGVMIVRTALRGPAPAAARLAEPDAMHRPRVAIASVQLSGAGAGTDWLREGLPQMIAGKIARSADVDVVAPAQLRAIRERAGYAIDAPLTQPQLRDLARRAGAAFAISGTLAREDSGLLLDLAIYDVTSGRLLRTDAVSRSDALTLADEAAARVLGVVGAQGPGLRLSELETTSLDAYQHYVGYARMVYEGREAEALRELDAAVALDSGFVAAAYARLIWAISRNDSAVIARMERALGRNEARASEYDRLDIAAFRAFYDGKRERSEMLAHQLVRRYPRDPRAYGRLADILMGHGRFADAERVVSAALALDSLGIVAGRGPCAPCIAYGHLARLRALRGDWAGAEQAARRWVALQPDIAGAWVVLAWQLAWTQRYDEALEAMRRAAAVTPPTSPPLLEPRARLLVMARRFDAADSVIGVMHARPERDVRAAAADLRIMLERERGQLRAAERHMRQAVAAFPELRSLELLRANTLARLGTATEAERRYETFDHPAANDFPPAIPRGFCWSHALLADAMADRADTLRLGAIADSLERGCARSSYGRDVRLHHHVRGLIAMRARRYAEAEREFRQAAWTVGEGWTRTTIERAKAQIALGRPDDAVATLRVAYAAPLDAMARYAPRTEIDYWMASAFMRAGRRDSAAVYASHFQRAWRGADQVFLEAHPWPNPYPDGSGR